MKTLKLAPTLKIPATFAGRSAFVAGTKGSGKTYTAGVIAEELLAVEAHVVVLDPTGVWWGLRHDANGGPGGYPVVILGGPHGDVPLPPTGGEAVAEWIVRSGRSAVLDLSGFGSDAEQDRFVEAFMSRLYRIKAEHRDSLHLILDEADLFIPEEGNRLRGQEKLVHATKTIVTKGRSRGLGMTMVTQRPQSIRKSAIEEADVVFIHRMQGLRAVKAMSAWTDLYASKEEAATFYNDLPQLADGECFVWSPRFLKTFERVRIREKRTFDSSRTPEPGERVKKPSAAAEVDLTELSAELRAAAVAKEADDPKKLRATIADLKKQLAAAATLAEPKTVVQRVEVPILTDSQIATLAEIAADLRMAAGGIDRAIHEYGKPAAPVKFHNDPPPKPKSSPTAIPAPSTNGTLSKTAGALLNAAAGMVVPGDRQRIAAMAGRSVRSSTVQEAFAELEKGGYLEKTGLGLEPTDKGRAAATPVPSLTAREWVTRLDTTEAGILSVLIDASPGSLTRNEIAERLNRSAKSSTFQEAFPPLVSRGLIIGGSGSYQLAPAFAG